MSPEAKSVLSSKTFWTSVCVALTPVVAAFVPGAGEWLSQNAEWVCSGLGAVFGVLRLVTTDPVR